MKPTKYLGRLHCSGSSWSNLKIFLIMLAGLLLLMLSQVADFVA